MGQQKMSVDQVLAVRIADFIKRYDELVGKAGALECSTSHMPSACSLLKAEAESVFEVTQPPSAFWNWRT